MRDIQSEKGGLDVDPTIRAPQDQHIVLINDVEVHAALKGGR